MAYTLIGWKDLSTPAINEAHLNHMDDQILLNSQDIHTNTVAVHNLQSGVGGAIIGTKHTVTEIYAIPSAKINDIWIDASTNHGWRSDGQGAGASHWTDVGVMRVKGDKGDKGNNGATGVGLEITSIYDTVVAMKAANPAPSIDPIEMHFVKENSGEFWAYEDTVPPHDGSHAAWHKVADHIQGPKGDKGDPGTPGKNGADGHDGASVKVATQTEVNAGTDKTKAVTPAGLTGWLRTVVQPLIPPVLDAYTKTESDAKYMVKRTLDFLPLSGGTMLGRVKFKDGTTDKGYVGSAYGGTSLVAGGGAAVVAKDSGGVLIAPKAGQKATVGNREIITGTYDSATKTLTLDV